VSIYQLLTGGLLIAITPGVSIASVCVRGLLLVTTVGAVHAAVAYRLKPVEDQIAAHK
jgi:hypothetical protein